MAIYSLWVLALVLVGCGDNAGQNQGTTTTQTSTSSTTGTTGSTSTTSTVVTTTGSTTTTSSTTTSTSTTTTTDIAAWNFLVFINGDNDLEFYVTADINELEGAGSGDNVNVLVQADRAVGYYGGDGDWTETRRYYVTYDEEPNSVTSELVQSLGEVDMGDPESLSEFLFWAAEEYPAEHTVLIMWNHGDGWSADTESDEGSSDYISWDEGDDNWMSIAEGDLNAGLEAYVDLYGRLDIIGFDACNMSTWEVAHSLRNYADYMTASQTTVGMSGYQYDVTINDIHEDGTITPEELADSLVWAAAELNGEWSQSVTDLSLMDELADEIDQLALMVLDDINGLGPMLVEARNDARGADFSWENYYLDLGDFSDQLSAVSDEGLSAKGDSIRATLDDAVLSNYTNQPYNFLGGLDIFADYGSVYLQDYSGGGAATWAVETHWDEVLTALAEL